MLKRIRPPIAPPAVPISEAAFPTPFSSGLEYAPPARGTWNIVHTGMLLPGAHQIFVCAEGCLRGVVLTAAEMNAGDRFSTVAIREENVLDGRTEELIVDGVSAILTKLPRLPDAVLLFTSCIHHFIGCDLPLVYRRLRAAFPAVDFTDCYMNPIMRKSGLSPDQLMRRQLYSLLKPRPLNPRSVSLIGDDFATDPSCEMMTLLKENGYVVREIQSCQTYAQYQEMAESAVCITDSPAAIAAGDALETRLGQRHLHLPFSFDPAEITDGLTRLCQTLSLPLPDVKSLEARAHEALATAHAVIGDTPIVVDYTACPRPLGLTRLLTENGFRVTRVYADGFSAEEVADFAYLKEHAPALLLFPTVAPVMRVLPRKTDEKTLAIGQKPPTSPAHHTLLIWSRAEDGTAFRAFVVSLSR